MDFAQPARVREGVRGFRSLGSHPSDSRELRDASRCS